MKNERLQFKYAHPLIETRVIVEYFIPTELSSIERFILTLGSKFDCSLHGLSSLLPFPPHLANYFIAQFLQAGLFQISDDTITISEYGKISLESGKINLKESLECSVLLDPITKKIVHIYKGNMISSFSCVQKVNYNFQQEFLKIESILMAYCKEIEEFLIMKNTDQEKLFTVQVSDIKIIESPIVTYIPVNIILEHQEGQKFLINHEAKDIIFSHNLFEVWGEQNSFCERTDALLEQLVLVEKFRMKYFLLNFSESFKADGLKEWVETVIETTNSKTSFPLKLIFDKEHPYVLDDLIRKSKHEIYVSSGWIGMGVLDRIHNDLVKCLSRGVKVHFLFGFKNKNDNNGYNNTEIFDRINLLKQNHNNFYCVDVHDEFHQKAIVVDELIAVIGSYNWLSNRGHSSLEASLYIENEKFAIELKNKAMLKRIGTDYRRTA